MSNRSLVFIVALAGWATTGIGQAQESIMPTDVRRVVEAHCVSCHGAEKPKASLDLTRYKTADDLRAGHEIWKEAIRYKINDGKGRVVRDVIA